MDSTALKKIHQCTICVCELLSDTVISYSFTWGKGYKECQVVIETSYSNIDLN